MKNVFRFTLLYLLGITIVTAQEKYTLSGYVKDASNGEDLIGVSVLIKEQASGNITNVYGFYSVTVDPGEYTIEYNYIGFSTHSMTVTMDQDRRIDIELDESKTSLDEVVIVAENESSNVTDLEMSVAKLSINTISKVPALMGEVDVIRSIQLLPGVNTVGEGASGFNVRGGNVGQNLVLLDEAPVYNSSHLFGFFSVFNPDAVKDVKLYKGGIPAKYGGRLSSVLDVRMKEGNSKELDVNGGVGLIFSRLAVEAPIVKDKASFIVAGRRSYIDILAAPLLDNTSLFFYDLTTKVNYNVNNNNKLFLSGYFGRDVFNFTDDQGFSWGNQTATIRWNHIINNRMFFNFTSFYSNYDYELGFGDGSDNIFELDSHIQGINLKPEFTFFINTNNELSFGGNFLHHRFIPGDGRVESEGQESNIDVDDKQGLESAIYISNRQEVGEKVSVEYGLRLSNFRYLGGATVYEFGEVEPGVRRPVIDQFESDFGETIKQFTNLEPRFSFKYQLNNTSSLKVSYNRMAQYIHLLSNTTASIPLDNWMPSTNNIDPQIADQFAVGYFRNFAQNKYEASVEGYFKSTSNQPDYIDGANLLVNELVEGEILAGEGRAYGIEFYLKKNTGKLTGWLSYTLSRSELQVEGINNGNWYPTRFDQTNNFKIVGFYDLNKRLSFSTNFTYATGTPTIFPTTRYEIQGYTVPHNDNNARNDVRIPDFHRLDLSMTLKGREMKRGKERKNKDSWTFSLYNVYGHDNAYSIYFAQSDGVPTLEAPTTNAYQFSVIDTIIPSISYNFNF